MKNDTLRRRTCTSGSFGYFARTTLRAAAVAVLIAPFAGTITLADEAPATNSASSEKAKLLDPVVVVASRTPEKLSEVSPSVTYIDAVDLQRRGILSLSDALRDVPGVYAAQSGATGSQTSLFTRGTNSNMTAILLDGRRLNSGFSGGYDITNIGTDNLASVQMMRGATSTLYGASAMGGVIDMRSTNGLDLTRPVASFSGEGGSYGFWRTVLQVAGNDAQVSELASGNYEGTSQNSPNFGFSVGGSWTQTDNKRPNNDYRNGYILPRFDYRVNDNLAVNLLTRYSDYRLGLPGSTVNPWDPNYPGYDANNWQSGYDWLVSPGVTAKIGENVEVQAFYSYNNSVMQSRNAGGPDARYEQDKHEATILATWHALEMLDVSGGYTFEETIYDSRNVYTPYEDSWYSNSPFLRLQLKPIEDLKIEAGGRFNAFNNCDNAWTGEGAISYRIRPTDTTLYAKVANGYRTPSASDIAGGTVGNQQLKPEQNVSWEVGVKQNFDFLKGAMISVVYFENYLDDLIDFQMDPVTYAYQSFNVDKAVTRGWEINGEVLFTQKIKLYGNLSFLSAHSKSDVPSSMISDGDRLRRRPDFTMTGGVEVYPWDTVTVGFSVTYVHGREDFDWNNYETVDLKDYVYGRVYASWRFWEHAELFGRIENCFDAKYDGAALNYPALPITAYAGMRFMF